jgi:ATP-dependent helicase HrpB
MTQTSIPLPIDSLLGELVALAGANNRLVVEAPAGAGKTTRVPPALLHARLWSGEIWVAEPRRLAAKLMALRVSMELNRKLGDLVGYTVRFDDCSSPKTRIRYVTSGILLRRLLADPSLTGIDCVILDEFHERQLDADLALALVARAQDRRPELRLCVMSATLDGARISELLGGCPRIKSDGRLYPLEIEFQTQSDDRPLEKRVSSALRRLIESDPNSSILVFLPGAAEIRRARTTLLPLCEQARIDVRVLHGDLSLDAQTEAIVPGRRPRVVLTTNIAESSITVEGITGVIDSGLSRQKDCSTSSGMSRLTVQKISRASAIQRAGRAGRIAPGRVIRLYTRGDFDTRPEFDIPEILRTDFAEALLLLIGAAQSEDRCRAQHPPSDRTQSGRLGPPKLSGAAAEFLDQRLFLDRPTPAAVETARSLLRQLGSIDEDDRLTSIGRRMSCIPLHPRLSRLLIECEARRIGDLGALVAALLSERDLRHSPRARFDTRIQCDRLVFSGDSDVVAAVELYLRGRETHPSHSGFDELGIDRAAFRAVQHAHHQLRRLVDTSSADLELDPPSERELATALLVAFPDRVAKRRTEAGPEIVLRSGATARLSESSVVTKPPWLVAIDVEERRDSDRSPGSIVRIASAIDEDWLVDVVSGSLVNEEELCWVDPPGRVEVRSRIRLGSLTVQESRYAAKPGPKVVTVLLQVAEQSGLLQCEEVTRLFARLKLISELPKGHATTESAFADAKAVLSELLLTRIDLDGLDGATLVRHLVANLPRVVADSLRVDVPEAITLSNGRRCQVHYDEGRPAWIASRLQDFFGLTETPAILGGRMNLVVHLLAPNQRPVQITNDLRSFWSNQYPGIRRELSRRYPRHPWPEDGLSASPPLPRPTERRR